MSKSSCEKFTDIELERYIFFHKARQSFIFDMPYEEIADYLASKENLDAQKA